jgi:hypothetical protein
MIRGMDPSIVDCLRGGTLTPSPALTYRNYILLDLLRQRWVLPWGLDPIFLLLRALFWNFLIQ